MGRQSVKLSITGLRSELGGVLAALPGRSAAGRIHVNVVGQGANTLLHDGHAWKNFARVATAGTRRALSSARSERRMLVHASFAFVHAVEQGADVPEPLRSLIDVILECEARVLASTLPVCVVRLGYLYGAQSSDLRAYRTAFRLGRPYWSGPAGALQYHLHQLDAAAALLTAARPRNAGRTFYATDDRPVSFMRLMDAFARRVGRRNPLHLPLFSRPLARVIVREEHMQQAALGMPATVPRPRPPGWRPKFADYREGLEQVLQAWDA